ncbi:hypothetical protein N7G274_002439 [Stereocaulon virgatum]|uniref:SP-RING-type domain-containing protein n=1 Tax=Stereocaulon virgatum TaxID=373712 RepID=A0ABR4AGT4_9LECA
MAPSRSRPATTTTVDRQSQARAQLPAYQLPQHPLNEAAQRALQNLPRNHKLDALKTRQRAANKHLTQAAADINDRLQDKTAEFERRRRNLEKQSSHHSIEEDPILDDMRRNVDDMTERLDASVRKIIDASAEVEGMERALRGLLEDVSNTGSYGGATQSTVGASQARPRRRRQGVGSDDEESDFGDEATQIVGVNDSVMAALKQKIAEQRAAYQKMSMSHRYASHNDYIGFKKIVHDAHYPEDKAPHMPHASTWFPSESPDPSHPATRAAAAAGDAIEDDDDLAVASERVSIKCPLTLLPMKEPVTSQKCPHSFEKGAILDMINRSDITLEGSGRRGVKAMKCPVCVVLLTANDLREDPVLIRKIKRIQAAQNAQNDEYSDDEDISRQTRPAGGQTGLISSSPAMTRTPKLKTERQSQAPSIQSRQVSMVPNTQIERSADEEEDGPSNSPFVDLEDDEDTDD